MDANRKITFVFCCAVVAFAIALISVFGGHDKSAQQTTTVTTATPPSHLTAQSSLATRDDAAASGDLANPLTGKAARSAEALVMRYALALAVYQDGHERKPSPFIKAHSTPTQWRLLLSQRPRPVPATKPQLVHVLSLDQTQASTSSNIAYAVTLSPQGKGLADSFDFVLELTKSSGTFQIARSY